MRGQRTLRCRPRARSIPAAALVPSKKTTSTTSPGAVVGEALFGLDPVRSSVAFPVLATKLSAADARAPGDRRLDPIALISASGAVHLGSAAVLIRIPFREPEDGVLDRGRLRPRVVGVPVADEEPEARARAGGLARRSEVVAAAVGLAADRGGRAPEGHDQPDGRLPARRSFCCIVIPLRPIPYCVPYAVRQWRHPA